MLSVNNKSVYSVASRKKKAILPDRLFPVHLVMVYRVELECLQPRLWFSIIIVGRDSAKKSVRNFGFSDVYNFLLTLSHDTNVEFAPKILCWLLLSLWRLVN